MLRYSLKFYIILVSIFLISGYNISYSKDLNLTGKIVVYKDNDINMMLAKLIKNDGEEIILGALGNMPANSRQCIYEADDRKSIVHIYAKYSYDGIDDRTIICKPAKIHKIIGPIILGLQIGISKQKAIETIKKYFSNEDRYYILAKEVEQYNYFNLTVYNNSKVPTPILGIKCEDDILDVITVYNDQLTKNSQYYLAVRKQLLTSYNFVEYPPGTYSYISKSSSNKDEENLGIIINNSTIIIHD